MFESKSDLSVHVQDAHHECLDDSELEQSIQCPHCPTLVKTETGLRLHIYAKHDPPKDYQCEHCGDTFKQGKSLDTHILQKHFPDQYEYLICPVCSIKLSNAHTLQRHLRVKHRAEVKTKRETNSRYLTTLLIRCPGESEFIRYELPEDHRNRRSVSTRKNNPKVTGGAHKQRDEQGVGLYEKLKSEGSGELGSFECTKCSEVLNSAMALVIHQNEEHPTDRGFKCSQCGDEFKLKSTLEHHIIYKHFPEQYVFFQCVFCPKKYPGRKALRKHLNQFHKAEHVHFNKRATHTTLTVKLPGDSEAKSYELPTPSETRLKIIKHKPRTSDGESENVEQKEQQESESLENEINIQPGKHSKDLNAHIKASESQNLDNTPSTSMNIKQEPSKIQNSNVLEVEEILKNFDSAPASTTTFSEVFIPTEVLSASSNMETGHPQNQFPQSSTEAINVFVSDALPHTSTYIENNINPSVSDGVKTEALLYIDTMAAKNDASNSASNGAMQTANNINMEELLASVQVQEALSSGNTGPIACYLEDGSVIYVESTQ